jgi:hypothetical protein
MASWSFVRSRAQRRASTPPAHKVSVFARSPQGSLRSSLARPRARFDPPTRTQVAALGTLAYAACAFLPSIHRAALLPRSAFVLLGLAPALLALGLWLAPARKNEASYLLLTGFPIALALSISRLEHDLALTTFSPAVLGFAFLSLAAYAASAVALCATPLGTRKVEQRPLGEVAPIEAEARKQVLGSAVLATLLVGSMFVTMWASWASPAQYREQWGRAAAEGATLTALAGGFSGCLMLALVGPALRAERAPESKDERARKLTWLLSVAASGALVYIVLALH